MTEVVVDCWLDVKRDCDENCIANNERFNPEKDFKIDRCEIIKNLSGCMGALWKAADVYVFQIENK